ncbi:WD40-repeat-containing domain protein [Flammula alnicola]|nr:WD40-repeat-containing domain protein [Flammula alnicola]
MPKNLPGFYWDEARNRYFPLSSRPKQPPPPADTIASNHHKKTLTNFEASTPTDSTDEKRKRWLILRFHYASTSRLSRVRIPTLGYIQAFCSTQLGGRTWRFIGDNQGWLYSDKDFAPETRHGIHYWSADLNLQPSSPISSICVSGSRCVSTCLGPGKIAVQDLSTPERMFLLNLNGVYDIWASDLQGQTLVLGASRKAVYIPDIDVSSSLQYLHTKSDVFSVIQQDNLVYTGSRNGTIERFDMRLAKDRSQKIFDTRFKTAPRSSVLHLSLIHGQELLMSHLNGDLVSFDLRFSSSTSGASPVKVFHGHVNTYTHHLGIGIDREQGFLFAAGQDCCIRGWSLKNGTPLSPPSATTNPFLASFPHPVRSLQVTDEPGEAGISLWAASDQDLYQFHLGQRTMAIT